MNHSSNNRFSKANDPQQSSYFTGEELQQWQRSLEEANRSNIWCHCKACNAEWVASSNVDCLYCGSQQVEHIACWQFPDD